jgi:hypothetical protein
MELLLLAIWVVLGAWCADIARKRGRSPVWGAIWGVLFGFIAIIIYLIMGYTAEQKEKDLNDMLDRREKRANKAYQVKK